ncbi:CidA/LrgA family protein [Aquibacillus albus]|uniref:Holin-like protein n=1 Tax=Aquibacillus albus TaxID=1168171 RepID=A0ABS2N2Z4_9BACI|nr:CidA/LrgA family protein [Aquibacillus albus]MBM7572459.1 holin-like protein [Aquibacillus albus]
MKVFRIIIHIIILYSIYIVGVSIQKAFDLFIPGSIIGMILFFLLLVSNIIKPAWVEEGTNYLIRIMPLIFVPVTVGIINYLGVFSGKGTLLILIALFSTALVMISSSLIAQWLLKRKADTND